MSTIEKDEKPPATDVESGQGGVSVYIDVEAEKSCVRKLDLVLLPFLTLVSVTFHLGAITYTMTNKNIDVFLQFS
jgi:hypothetical protein